jgi:hypothetical protein
MTDKHLIKHNVMGLMQIGFEMGEALDMALDAEEDLFPENWKQLKLRRPGVGSGASGHGGPVSGPSGHAGTGWG